MSDLIELAPDAAVVEIQPESPAAIEVIAQPSTLLEVVGDAPASIELTPVVTATLEVAGDAPAVIEISPAALPQVLETVTAGPQGPKGDRGEPGAPGDGVDAISYLHIQNVAAETWTIHHGLSFTPNIVVVDSAGSVVIGSAQYLDAQTIQLSFAGAFSGRAILS